MTSNGVGTCGADDNQAQAGHIVAQTIGGQVTHTLSSEGSDASEDGTGRGTPIVAQSQVYSIMPMNSGRDYKARPVDVAQPLMTSPVGGNQGGDYVVTPLAIRGREGGAELEAGEPNAPANALRSAGGGGDGSLYPLVSISQNDTPKAVHENVRGEITTPPVMGSLTVGGGKPGQGYPAIHAETIVRRLTPLECERLQGYPDGWTDNGQADSARYRQLGNSVAVPCVEWIARRLVAVDNELGRK